MASKEKREKILKELGLTKKDMSKIWAHLVEKVEEFEIMDEEGCDWKHLPGKTIRQLPEMEREFKEQERKASIVNILDEFNATVPEKQAELVWGEGRNESEESLSWEDEMLQKIDSGERLSEEELQSLVFEGNEVSTKKGENRRWSRTVDTVIELNGRFFMIEWDEGLTECQENEFYEQPYEVTPREYEKTITVTDWVRIEKEPELENDENECCCHELE